MPIAYGRPGAIVASVAGQVELAAAADVPVPRRPGRDRARVAGQDRVVGGQPVELRRQVLRRDRVAVGRLQRGHRRPASRASCPGTSPGCPVGPGARAAAAAPPGSRRRRRPAARRSGSGCRPGPGRCRPGPPSPARVRGRNFVYGKFVPSISSVSTSSISSSLGAVPSSPRPPVVYGESSGSTILPEQRLDHRRAERVGDLLDQRARRRGRRCRPGSRPSRRR